MLEGWGKPQWLPNPNSKIVDGWTSIDSRPGLWRGTWTAVTFVAWAIRNTTNDVVFNGASPSTVLDQVAEEGQR